MKKLCKRMLLVLVLMNLVCCFSITANATKYLSLKNVGLKKFQSMDKYRIISISGKTVRYGMIKTVPKNDDFEIKVVKIKTAKLTSKTKYYLGSIKEFNKTLLPNGASFLNKKWITKVNKSKFKKALTGKEWWDVVVVKNGKAVKLFTKMQLAS